MGYVPPSSFSIAPPSPPYYAEIGEPAPLQSAQYPSFPLQHHNAPPHADAVASTPVHAHIAAPVQSDPAPTRAVHESQQTEDVSRTHASPSSNAVETVERLAERVTVGTERVADARHERGMTLNFFLIDAPLLACAMFLTSVLTFVPSALYAGRETCTNTPFVVEAFLLSVSSIVSTGLLTASSLMQRSTGRTLARATQFDPGSIRKRLKRTSAVTGAALAVSGFATAMAVGSVVTHYGRIELDDADCPPEYANVAVAGALITIASSCLALAHQAMRQYGCARSRRD